MVEWSHGRMVAWSPSPAAAAQRPAQRRRKSHSTGITLLLAERRGHNCRVRLHKPMSLNADTIMALLGVPVDVLHTDTVSKSAAQSVSTPKMLEPFLKRRIGEAAIVTRV